MTLNRVFFDTNVYIVGKQDIESNEYQILKWAGFEVRNSRAVEVVIYDELLQEILRVSKRLKNKDWGGQIVNNIWRNFQIIYVTIDADEYYRVEALGVIPREDVGVYLTAKLGNAECFVSANHELIRTLAEETREFECLTPEEFVNKYLE